MPAPGVEDRVAPEPRAGGHGAAGPQRVHRGPPEREERPGVEGGGAVGPGVVSRPHESPPADPLAAAAGVVQVGKPESMAGLVGDRADAHDGRGIAGGRPAELGLDRVIVDLDELGNPVDHHLLAVPVAPGRAGDEHPVGPDARRPGRRRGAVHPAADHEPVTPDAGGRRIEPHAFAADLGLEKAHEIDDSVVVPAVGDPVRAVVVELGPEGIAPGPAAHRIQGGDHHQRHPVDRAVGTVGPARDGEAVAAVGVERGVRIQPHLGQDHPIECDPVLRQLFVVGGDRVGPVAGIPAGRGIPAEQQTLECGGRILDRLVTVSQHDHRHVKRPGHRGAGQDAHDPGQRPPGTGGGDGIERLEIALAQQAHPLGPDLGGAAPPRRIRAPIEGLEQERRGL